MFPIKLIFNSNNNNDHNQIHISFHLRNHFISFSSYSIRDPTHSHSEPTLACFGAPAPLAPLPGPGIPLISLSPDLCLFRLLPALGKDLCNCLARPPRAPAGASARGAGVNYVSSYKFYNNNLILVFQERDVIKECPLRPNYFLFTDSNGPCTKRSCNHHSICVESGDLAFCECPDCTMVTNIILQIYIFCECPDCNLVNNKKRQYRTIHVLLLRILFVLFM